MKALALAAIVGLMPLGVGPLPAEAQVLTAKLCNGGTIDIPIRREQPADQPCIAKGCHAGSCRKRIDLAQ